MRTVARRCAATACHLRCAARMDDTLERHDLDSSGDREPSIFLIALHIIMWTTLGCGLIMVMVVVMMN